mmetsp:Transcript_4783/g.7007  ORF Transcript_4783/g.7007 Transcript_4783/m.7007 type:complete len:105 (+) Transcript_4783:1130-1444(+)
MSRDNIPKSKISLQHENITDCAKRPIIAHHRNKVYVVFRVCSQPRKGVNVQSYKDEVRSGSKSMILEIILHHVSRFNPTSTLVVVVIPSALSLLMLFMVVSAIS